MSEDTEFERTSEVQKRDLAKVPEDWLIEELMRRRNAEPIAMPANWCHDCKNFVSWIETNRAGIIPDKFNPCKKGREMKFMPPEDYGDEHGFYLRVCPDRDAA